MSTEKRVLHSTLAAYGSQLTRMVVRMVADFAMMRLLLPESHGLFEQAYGIVIIAGFFRDLGIPYQVVRDPRRPFGALFAWELVAGSVVTAGLFIAAPLTAVLNPELPQVLRWLCFYVLLDGLSVVPRTYFEAELQVQRIVGPEILRSLTFASVAIGLGALGWGTWSLVVGQLAALSLLTLGLWWQARGLIRLDLRPKLALDMVRSSAYLFLIALTANAVLYVGPYVIEVFDSTDMVGHYSKALHWAFLLQTIVVPALIRVLYPALIAYRGDHTRFVAAYHLCTVSVLSLEAITTWFMFFNAEVIMLEIFGSSWGPAVPMLRILCVLPLVEPFTRLGGEILKVRNEDRVWFAGVVINLICLLVFGVMLTAWLGATGMAWANYLMLGNVLIAWRLYRIFKRDFLRLCVDLLKVYALPTPFFLVALWLFPAASWERFFASATASAITFAVLAYRLQTPLRDFFRGQPEGAGEVAPA